MKLLSIVGKGYHTEENVEVERAKILLSEFGADDTELFLADEPVASAA